MLSPAGRPATLLLLWHRNSRPTRPASWRNFLHQQFALQHKSGTSSTCGTGFKREWQSVEWRPKVERACEARHLLAGRRASPPARKPLILGAERRGWRERGDARDVGRRQKTPRFQRAWRDQAWVWRENVSFGADLCSGGGGGVGQSSWPAELAPGSWRGAEEGETWTKSRKRSTCWFLFASKRVARSRDCGLPSASALNALPMVSPGKIAVAQTAVATVVMRRQWATVEITRWLVCLLASGAVKITASTWRRRRLSTVSQTMQDNHRLAGVTGG